MNDDFFEKIQFYKETGVEIVTVTLVHSRGSSPQEVGAKIIVSQEGLLWGTVGGGKVEIKAIEYARNLLTTDNSTDYCEWNLQTDVGMTCGGVVSFYFERLKFSEQSKGLWSIAIFGAGHVAQEVVRLLIKLDCQVTCVDPREDWLRKLPEHPRLKKIQLDVMKDFLQKIPANTFIASMTMGHSFDSPILLEAMTKHNFPYIGVIGSDSKARVLKNDLLKNGAPEKKVEELFCPIGEPIGNNSPVEIAISIVAQLMKHRDLNKISA